MTGARRLLGGHDLDGVPAVLVGCWALEGLLWSALLRAVVFLSTSLTADFTHSSSGLAHTFMPRLVKRL